MILNSKKRGSTIISKDNYAIPSYLSSFEPYNYLHFLEEFTVQQKWKMKHSTLKKEMKFISDLS